MIWDARSLCSAVAPAASGTCKSQNWCWKSYDDVVALQVRCGWKILEKCPQSYSLPENYRRQSDYRRYLTLKESRFLIEEDPFGLDYRKLQLTFKRFAFSKVCRSK